MDTIISAGQDGLGELKRYWEGLARDGFHGEPDVARDLPQLAPKLMIVDVSASGFRYRYYGVEIARMNGDQTGKPVGGTSLDEQAKLHWVAMLRAAATTRLPQLAQVELDSGAGAYLVALPLSAGAAVTKSILAGHFFYGRANGRVVIRAWRNLSFNHL